MRGRWNHWSIDVDIGIRVAIVVLNVHGISYTCEKTHDQK